MRRPRGVSVLSATAAMVAMSVTPLAAQQGGSIDRQIRENQDRLQNIRQQRSDLQRELDRIQNRAHSLESELQNLERQKTVTTRIVNELDRQMRSLSEQLDTATLDLVLTQNARAEKQAVLRRRLTEIYKRGPLWTVQVLLSAESFGDLLSRYKYLFLVSRQDRALVHEIQELETRVERQRRQLLTIRNELAARRNERGTELDRFAQLEQDRQNSLRQARSSQRRATTRLDSLDRAETELNDLLANLERERRRALAARGESDLGLGSISDRDLGTLDWPLDGKLVYTFGRAAGPGQTTIRYTGIGIAAPVGTPVRAVAQGVVDIAGFNGLWGPMVVLNHGGGFYTVYAHLSRLDIVQGTRVSRGQQIGLSGGEGTEEGPHIEFQIRQGENGSPIALDPLNWLKRRN